MADCAAAQRVELGVAGDVKDEGQAILILPVLVPRRAVKDPRIARIADGVIRPRCTNPERLVIIAGLQVDFRDRAIMDARHRGEFGIFGFRFKRDSQRRNIVPSAGKRIRNVGADARCRQRAVVLCGNSRERRERQTTRPT